MEYCNTADAVDREMKNLNSKPSKIIALKENIMMRVIGLGKEDRSTHWSKNGKAFTPEELVSHLKMIVSKQWSRYMPAKPPVLLPVKEALQQLGTQAPDIVAMDSDLLGTCD